MGVQKYGCKNLSLEQNGSSRSSLMNLKMDLKVMKKVQISLPSQ
jgi:hypothetical protein